MAANGEAAVEQFACKRSGCEEGMAKAMSDEQCEQKAHRSESAAPKLFGSVPLILASPSVLRFSIWP